MKDTKTEAKRLKMERRLAEEQRRNEQGRAAHAERIRQENEKIAALEGEGKKFGAFMLRMWRKVKDFLIRAFVSLKRNTQNLSLILIIISCMVYTFNLTELSNAAVYVSSQIIALYVFILTLASILVIFSFMNAYSRGKARPLMLGIVFLLLGVQIWLDTECIAIYNYEVYGRADPAPLTVDIAKAIETSTAHRIWLAVATISIVLLPLIRWILSRINISIVDDELVELDDQELIVEDEEDEFLD